MEDGRPLLILTTENAPAEYIEYLREKGISYIAIGKEQIDLAGAMEILGNEFGVEAMLPLSMRRLILCRSARNLSASSSLTTIIGLEYRLTQPCME